LQRIKRTIDNALQDGNFTLAEELYETQHCDIAADAEPIAEPAENTEAQEESAKPEYELPNSIRNVVRKCHIVKGIAEKVKNG
jgi:hypothetical protein